MSRNCQYQYVASGYKHDVFRCLDYAYKIVKDKFEEYNNREHFETECLAISLLRKNGFCVPKECEILPPNETFKNKWVLKESWIEGKQYHDGEMSLQLEKKVYETLIEISSSIKGDYWGPINLHADKSCRWHSFLKYLHENHPLTRKACPQLTISTNRINELISYIVPENPTPVFILMDTNLMNFFFDMKGNIIGITDIEHPIYGDFLFMLANIRWCRDHWFHRDDWYSHWVLNSYFVNDELIDLYEFLIAFQEIELRYKTGTSHQSIDSEFLKLEKKLISI